MLAQNKINQKINKTTLSRISAVYEYLLNNKYSDFYKRKYKKAGIKFKKIEKEWQFEKLPYLVKEEILNAGPDNFLFIPKSKIDHVGISSGTTNKDLPMVLFINSRGYPKNMLSKRFVEYYDLKIKKVMLLYSSLNLMRRFHMNYELTKKGILMIPSDLNNLTATAKIAKRLQIDAIETTSSILYYFIPYLKKEYDINKIRLINLGGEFTSEEKYDYFKNVFKNAAFVFNSGGVETGKIGERCRHLASEAPRLFHPVNHLYYEIINPDKEGELVVTSLTRGKWPFVIRYKTGNSIRFIDHKCPCKKPTFELFGKIGNDVVKIQGGFIYANQIYEALIPYYKYLNSHDFRLHVYEVFKKNTIMARLVLQLEVKKQNDTNELKKEIRKKVSENIFLSSNSNLSDLVKKGIFTPLEIEFVEVLPFNPKQSPIVSHLT